MDTIICKEVIVSTIARRGKGVYRDPVRVITQVFEKSGELIAEYDPQKRNMEFSTVDMAEFARWVIERNIKPDSISIIEVNDWQSEFMDKKPGKTLKREQ